MGESGPTAAVIRRAREDDATAVAPIVYSTASGMYDLFLRDQDRAVAAIEAAFRRTGSHASRDVTWVAERDGTVAGVVVAYPAREGPDRSRRFLRGALMRTAPWGWPRILRLHWQGERVAPRPPADSLYVDALGTDPAHRRRGVATALLARAERMAVEGGLSSLALDTAESNDAARALYLAAGFRVVERVAMKPPMPAALVLVKEVG